MPVRITGIDGAEYILIDYNSSSLAVCYSRTVTASCVDLARPRLLPYSIIAYMKNYVSPLCGPFCTGRFTHRIRSSVRLSVCPPRLYLLANNSAILFVLICYTQIVRSVAVFHVHSKYRQSPSPKPGSRRFFSQSVHQREPWSSLPTLQCI